MLDGGTEIIYERPILAGETLMATTKVASLEVKESKSLGRMLLITNQSTYRDAAGEVVATVNAQGIWY